MPPLTEPDDESVDPGVPTELIELHVELETQGKSAEDLLVWKKVVDDADGY